MPTEQTMAEVASPALSQTPMLQLHQLNAWYGESHVLHGIDLRVMKGEIVTLLGRNGAGKTTTLKSIIGVMSKRSGSVKVQEIETIDLPSRKIAKLGLGYVPEERGIYASLSVEENLMLPPRVKDGGLTVDEIFTLFPNIKERLSSQGTKLSGGEQQMLAMGRVLRTGADLLLLDEPTEGLAPIIVDQIGLALKELKKRGFTVLLVEQNFKFATQIADRHYVVEQGKVVDQATNDDVLRDESKMLKYLGV